MLARKDLNWSVTNARLYNEAFTGRAKVIPRCPHCLCEDHAGASCPHNPNPPVLGWFSDPRPYPNQLTQSVQPLPAPLQSGNPRIEICRNFNENRCSFARCRFQHVCLDCAGPHPALLCPRRSVLGAGTQSVRGRSVPRGRQGTPHPYFPRR